MTMDGQGGAGGGQVVVAQAGQVGDFVLIVGQFSAGEVFSVVGIIFGRSNEHVGEHHVIEAFGGGGIVTLDGVVDHQEGEEGVSVVSAGFSGHGAGLQLHVQVGQEVGGHNGDLAGEAAGFDTGDSAQQGVAAVAGFPAFQADLSVNISGMRNQGSCFR